MFVCPECGTVRDAPHAACPSHPDERLLDARDPEVQAQLELLDEQALDQRRTWGLRIGGTIGLALGALALALVGGSPHAMMDFALLFGPMAFGSFAGRRVAEIAAAPRFAAVTRVVEGDVFGAQDPEMAGFLDIITPYWLRPR